jgi:hypothetical protein
MKGGVIPRDVFEQRKARGVYSPSLSYEQFVAMAEGQAARVASEVADLKRKNAEYDADPSRHLVRCRYNQAGDAVPTTMSTAECEAAHAAWERKNHPANYYFFRPVVEGLTQVGDVAASLMENVPGVGKIASKIYQGFAPPGSAYYTNASMGEKALGTAASLFGLGRRARMRRLRGGIRIPRALGALLGATATGMSVLGVLIGTGGIQTAGPAGEIAVAVIVPSFLGAIAGYFLSPSGRREVADALGAEAAAELPNVIRAARRAMGMAEARGEDYLVAEIPLDVARLSRLMAGLDERGMGDERRITEGEYLERGRELGALFRAVQERRAQPRAERRPLVLPVWAAAMEAEMDAEAEAGEAEGAPDDDDEEEEEPEHEAIEVAEPAEGAFAVENPMRAAMAPQQVRRGRGALRGGNRERIIRALIARVRAGERVLDVMRDVRAEIQRNPAYPIAVAELSDLARHLQQRAREPAGADDDDASTVADEARELEGEDDEEYDESDRKEPESDDEGAKGKGRRRRRRMRGDGFFGDLWSGVKKYATRVVDVVRHGKRNDYPPKVRDLPKQIGDQPIVSARLRRDPIQAPLNVALNLITKGKWAAAKRKYAYDDLFHLGLELTVRVSDTSATDGKYVMEKNEVINVAPAKPATPKTETLAVPLKGEGQTLRTLLDGAKQQLGDRMFSYDAFTNNCQDFIVAVLVGSGLASPQNVAWVKQPVEGVLKELPGYTSKVARFATDLGALANVVLEGRGAHARFRAQLKAAGVKPAEYLRAARVKARKAGLDATKLGFSSDGEHKLQMIHGDRTVRFGAVGMGDHILYTLSKDPKADEHRRLYRARATKIRGDWKKDKHSPNSLAVSILW